MGRIIDAQPAFGSVSTRHRETKRATIWGVTSPVPTRGPQQRRPFRPDRGYRCAADIQNPSFSLGQTWRNDSKIPVIKRTLVLYE